MLMFCAFHRIYLFFVDVLRYHCADRVLQERLTFTEGTHPKPKS